MIPLSIFLFPTVANLLTYRASGDFLNGSSKKEIARSQVVNFPLRDTVAVSVSVLREGAPSPKFLVRLDNPADGGALALFLESSPNPQFFSRSAIYREVVATAYEYTEPRLGSTRWPTISESTGTLLFNLVEGEGGNQVATVPAVVEVFSTVDSTPQIREALVVERMDDGQWRVAGSGNTLTDALKTLSLEVTPSGVLYAVGLDDYGSKFVPGKSVVVGERVRPTAYGGWVYEVTEAGQLPQAEPAWWSAVGDNPSRGIGTCRVQARRYYQPVAHGPIKVDLV